MELYDHDELFFDVTEQFPEMRVKKASATVTLPKGADLVLADGYAGPRDRKYFTARVEEADMGDRIEYAVTRPLKPEMAFQVSVAFTKGAVQPGLMLRMAYADRQTGHLLSAIAAFMAGLLIILSCFIAVWKRVGKDPERQPTVPQVEPPEGISPAMMRYIVTGGRLDKGVVAATLVKLAQCGAIKIVQEGNRYRISRTGEPSALCLAEEKVFLDSLFASSDSLVVAVKHTSKRIRSMSTPLKEMLQREYKKYFVTHSRYLWRMLVLSVVAAAAGLFFLDLPSRGGGPGALLVYGGFSFTLLSVMLTVFYRLLKAPTQAGSRIMGRIEGFRKYLAVNYKEAQPFGERHGMDGPPFLEKYLSYAIALGIDSEYVSIRSKRFEWYGGVKKPGADRKSRDTKLRGTGGGL